MYNLQLWCHRHVTSPSWHLPLTPASQEVLCIVQGPPHWKQNKITSPLHHNHNTNCNSLSVIITQFLPCPLKCNHETKQWIINRHHVELNKLPWPNWEKESGRSFLYHVSSGIVKGGPGRARARPKHHVRTAHVMQSHAKRGLAYSRCPANTNDLATPLRVSLWQVHIHTLLLVWWVLPGSRLAWGLHLPSLIPW